jgi:hypothetical protein
MARRYASSAIAGSAKTTYSLRSIILFANVDVFRHFLVIDTFVFVKSNMDRRE